MKKTKTVDPARSANMRAIKSRGTQPELAVRAILHKLAPGYRLNRKNLPGKPDIAYGRRRLAIFVNGCFWHGHDCKNGLRKPKTNAGYWGPKIARNQERDAAAQTELSARGWRWLVVWECELKDRSRVRARLRRRLRGPARC